MTNTIYWYLTEAGTSNPSLEISELLHPEELARWKEMKIPKRQQEWQHGRATAKILLTAREMPFYGTPLHQIHIANQPEGAPYIASPKQTGNLSISHRESIAVAAYTQSNETHIGIDLEIIETRARSFVEDFFTPNEADFVRTLPNSLIDIWVTIVWSAKEAVLKAWQKGLRLDTRRVEILPADYLSNSLTTDTWMKLQIQRNITGYPDCWLFWQQRGNHILTIASTKISGGPDQVTHHGPPGIKFISKV